MKTLLREIHRRSLWQVLGLYLAGSWVALQVVEQLTTAAGLPDWVQPFALVLLVVGLPIVLGTAFVQVGVGSRATDAPPAGPVVGPESPSIRDADGAEPAATSGAAASGTSPSGAGLRRVLTWRHALIGGAAATVLLGGFVAAYFVMRATGVGPAASLVAQGVIEAGEPVLLAEFENSSDDPTLGGIVTEALRVDLSNGHAVSLVDVGTVRNALSRMGRDPDEPFGADLAHEVAVRDGIKAVISGEVGSAGSGYILLASIAPAEGGAPLATFRRTAKNADEIIPAIDGLSQDIREKAGESLRSIRAEEPLEAVTTSSLEALRRYSQADEAENRGEHMEARRLYEEALELDPEFAMAWRKLAVAASDAGLTREEARHAATRAYELRDRLTERERHLAAAYYHTEVTGNVEERIRAYRSVLADYPDDPTALNNLSIQLAGKRQYEEALALLERAVSGPGSTNSAFTNLAGYRAAMGDVDGARAVIELMPQRDVWYHWIRFYVAMVAGEWDEAHATGDEIVALPDAPEDWRSFGRTLPGVADVARGRVSEAREHFRAAATAARAAGRLPDALAAVLGLAEAERLVAPDSGRDRAVLNEYLESGDFAATPTPERDFGRLAISLARSGLVDEARSTVDDWAAAGGLAGARAGASIDDVRAEVEALVAGVEDPNAGIEALRLLRTRRDCPRCFATDLALALERAGNANDAIEELQRAIEVSEGGTIWFGVRRVLGRERLGRLYDEIGEPEIAAEHYAVFVDAWRNADPELQPRVEAVRARIAAIEVAER